MNKKPVPNTHAIFSFIAETGSLMQMPRSHNRFLGNTFDTVSSHSHHTAIIAYCLARLEGLSHEEGLKAIATGVLHDNAEVRTGDLNFVEKHYAETNEEKAIHDQLSRLPFGHDLLTMITEYEERTTLIAKCVKDADTLEQIYQQWVLTDLGNKEAERWLMGNRTNRVPYLRTEAAKRLAEYFYTSTPHDWWHEDIVGEKIDLKKLNGAK